MDTSRPSFRTKWTRLVPPSVLRWRRQRAEQPGITSSSRRSPSSRARAARSASASARQWLKHRSSGASLQRRIIFSAALDARRSCPHPPPARFSPRDSVFGRNTQRRCPRLLDPAGRAFEAPAVGAVGL